MGLNTTTVGLSISTGETTAVGITNNLYPVSYNYSPTQISNGTGANAAQKVCTINAQGLTTGGTTYDLTACPGGPAGATVNFSKIKLIVIQETGGVNALSVGNAGANQFAALTGSGTAVMNIDPGCCVFKDSRSSSGMTVDSTHKNLLVAAASGTANATLIIVGEGS